LRRTFPEGEVIVADDGSRDGTADVAEAAGAVVLRLPRLGKGQALSAAERAAPPGRLVLCDADLDGDVGSLDGGADLAVAAVAALGLADDLWSGPERGFRAHLRARRTTGILKLVGIPAVGLAATRRVSGALLVALSANALNQFDTRPGRALKVYLAAATAVG